MIKDFLEKLGFSQKETLVYLTLVQQGRLTANQLAQTTQLNRTTVYSTITGLLKKGLVLEDLGSPTSLYLPAPTSSLIEYFEKKESEIRKQKELAIRVADEVKRMTNNQPFQLAKISFVNERDIETHLINRTERWCQSLLLHDGIWRGFQDSRLLELYPHYFEQLYTKVLPASISQELITEDMPAELKFNQRNFPRRKVKIWKNGYDFTYSTWVVGDYVIMIQAKDSPYYLIEIKDPALAKNLRELFSGLWQFIK